MTYLYDIVDDFHEARNQDQKTSYSVKTRHSMIAMIIEIIEEKEGNIAYAEDFIHSVSTKWFLLLLSPRLGKKTVTLGMKLFYIVWDNIEYPGRKFKDTFTCMKPMIRSHFDNLELYFPILAIVFGATVSQQSFQAPFEVPTLMALLKPTSGKSKKNYTCPEMFPAFIEMLKLSIKNIRNLKSSEPSNNSADYFTKTIALLGSMYMQMQPLRDLLSSSDAIEEFLSMLFLLISDADTKSLDTTIEILKNEQLSYENGTKLYISLKFATDNSETLENRFMAPNNSK